MVSKCQFYHVINMKQQRCGYPKTKYGNSNEFCSPPIFMWRKECHKIVSSSTYTIILLRMCWSNTLITNFEIFPCNSYLINVEAFFYFTLLSTHFIHELANLQGHLNSQRHFLPKWISFQIHLLIEMMIIFTRQKFYGTWYYS